MHVHPRDLHSFPTRRSSDLLIDSASSASESSRMSTRGWYLPRARRSNGSSRNVPSGAGPRSEEHTSELQSLRHLVCRLLLEKKKKTKKHKTKSNPQTQRH